MNEEIEKALNELKNIAIALEYVPMPAAAAKINKCIHIIEHEYKKENGQDFELNKKV